ncbi:MAG: helix-turn-helix transcriptional regulator [Firmicutes bacterium]|nr:helix-turn-helix transcriptional regulator [Bacillota bacterium]
MVGEKIRDARKKLGLTQEQLAGHELTKSYVSQVELGRIRPSRKALEIIAKRLDKPVGYFLDNDEELRTVEVLLKASEALWLSHRLDEALVGLEEARHLAERMGRDVLLAKIQSMMGRLEMSRHRYREALDHLRSALSRLHATEEPEAVSETALALGQAAAAEGLFHEAVAYFRQSVDTARMARLTGPLAQALTHYGDFCGQHGEWHSALILYQEAYEAAALEPREAAELEVRMATALCELNRSEEATTWVSQAIAHLHQLKPGEGRWRLIIDIARCLFHMARYEEAVTYIRGLKAEADQRSMPAQCLVQALDIGLKLAAHLTADDWLREVVDWALAQPDDPIFHRAKAYALMLRGERQSHVNAALDDMTAALQYQPHDPVLQLKLAVMAVKARRAGAIDELWRLVFERSPGEEPRTAFLSGAPG